MTKQETLALIRQIKRDISPQFGVLEIGLFGSFARDTAGDSSDIDLCVKTTTPDPYLLVHFKEAVETRLQRRVDVVRLRPGMNSHLRAQIDKDVIYV